jgi:MFS family permease
MRLAGGLVDRHGDRVLPVIIVAFAATGLLPGVAHGVGALALALTAVGATSGALDVAVNTAAAHAEERTARPIMSLAHGCFSIGVIGASAATGLLRRADLSSRTILLLTGAVLLACAAGVLVDTTQRGRTTQQDTGVAPPWWHPPPRLLVLGVLTAAAFLVESVWQTWSAVHLERDLGASPFVGALGPACFGLAAAAGRLGASRWPIGDGGSALIRLGATVAAVGSIIAAAAPNVVAVLLGVMLAGLGTSICAPILFSLTGQGVRAGLRGAAMSTVTTLAYMGFAIAPAVVGALAGATTLPIALGATAAFAVALAAGATRARPARADELL